MPFQITEFQKMSSPSSLRKASGFTLVEVILAIGVFSLTIVAVIGLLGPIAQQVRDLQDTKVANTLPAPIREELNRIGFQYFVDDAFTTTENLPTFLFGTEDGARVIGYDGTLEAPGSVILRDGVAPDEIPSAEQYFGIEIEAPDPGGNLSYNAGDAYVAFRVEISWPNRLPDGSFVEPENRQTFEYFTAVVVGEPF